jgi:hypothetical protein
MTSLTISLEEGFSNDTVVVAVNGVEHYRRDGVSTKLQVGVADVFEVEAADGEVSIEVALPVRGLTGHLRTDTTEALFVGVSAESGALRFRHSTHAFGYA